MASIPRWFLPWLIFLLVFSFHYRSKVKTSYDSAYSIHLAMSLVREGDLDLDEYRDIIPAGDYRVIEVGGHIYSRYPEGPSIVAAPMVAAIKSLAKHGLHLYLDPYLRNSPPSGIEKVVASILVAVTAVVIFHLARRRLGPALSLLTAFVFAFCTSAWSVASRALWQHAPSMLFLSLALHALLRLREAPRWSFCAGLWLACAFVMRPTNALPVVLLTVYVAVAHRRRIGHYLGGAAVVALPFLASNAARFGSLLPWYYLQGGRKFQFFGAAFLEAAAGNLVSPGRGLFLYSPVFLFSLLGVWLSVRERRWTRLDSFLSAVLVLHWLLISSWHQWWGGSSFGPRLFADLIPILVYFLIPVLERLGSAAPGPGRLALAAGLAAAIAASFAIHRAGAGSLATWEWTLDPVYVTDDPSRPWDWHAPPFLRR